MLPLAQTLPFARLDPARHEVLVPAGEWTVNATVHVPDGWTLRLQAGARMRLASGIWLVVHGPCVADGTLSQPVEITGIMEVGGRAGSWGGVLVVGGTGSRWQHVVVRNASGQGVGAWQPGGAVVWVDGEAVLSDVQVTDTSAPTAAILASGAQFRCDRCTVDRTAGSGIVVEHGRTILNDITMHDLGGEGVDLTDATAVVRNLVVAQAAGATVRTGQDSDAEVLGVQGSRLGNGFVARDGGKLRVAKSRVSEVRHLGFLAYNQRSGDVPAQIDAREVEVTAAREHHLCTGGAVVKVQGRAQDCTAVSVQQLVAAGIARR
jgi:hypothetical protein